MLITTANDRRNWTEIAQISNANMRRLLAEAGIEELQNLEPRFPEYFTNEPQNRFPIAVSDINKFLTQHNHSHKQQIGFSDACELLGIPIRHFTTARSIHDGTLVPPCEAVTWENARVFAGKDCGESVQLEDKTYVILHSYLSKNSPELDRQEFVMVGSKEDYYSWGFLLENYEKIHLRETLEFPYWSIEIALSSFIDFTS